MKCLVLGHAEAHRITVESLFRTAYMALFGKDIPPRSLDEDVRTFHSQGITPKYVITYFLNRFQEKADERERPVTTATVEALRRAGM